jgi:hypothetical protein
VVGEEAPTFSWTHTITHILEIDCMFWPSSICCLVSAEADCRRRSTTPAAEKERRMEPFLVATVVIVGGFLLRYLRARTAH